MSDVDSTPQPSGDGAAVAAPLSVVVVDDDEPMRGLTRRLLSDDHGFEVVGEAANGEAAVKVVSEHQPAVVLLDLWMPGLSGHMVLPTLVRDAPRSMVLVLSALPADDRAEESFAAGAFAYLEKSVLGDGFAETVRDLRRLFDRALQGETVWVPDGLSRVRR